MSPASHPTAVELPSGTHALCTCGKSRNGSFCDGSHQGTGKVPHILQLDTARTVYLCSCAATGNSPFCDGSHTGPGAAVPTEAPRPWWKVWA